MYQVYKINRQESDTNSIESDTNRIESDTNRIESDTNSIESDTTTPVAKGHETKFLSLEWPANDTSLLEHIRQIQGMWEEVFPWNKILLTGY